MTAITGSVLALSLFATPVAIAAPDDSANSDEVTVPTMLVLDASGSMTHQDGDASGSTRMKVAKQAARSLVDQLDSDAQLGLMTYGANTTKAAKDTTKACQDIEVLAKVGTGNAAELKQGIEATEATQGETPIGASLRAAADELPGEGPRSIILVSDGEDTCAPPPPCDVAKELAKEGVDMKIHTIGFRADGKTRKELTCISEATGGTYSDAQDGDELADQLTVRATRTLQGYEVSGTPIEGGDALATAVETEPGTYLDTFLGAESFERDGQIKYYEIDLEEGQRVHASATLVPPPGNRQVRAATKQFWMRASIVDRGGKSCTATDVKNVGSGLTSFTQPVLASVSSVPLGAEPPQGRADCSTGPLYLKVERSGSELSDQPLPVELVVAVEPAGNDDGGEPASPEKNEGAALGKAPGGDPIEFGTSFDDAPVVEPGTYAIDMVPGDLRTVGVDVHEGQKLSWSIEVLEQDDDAIGDAGPGVEVMMHNPLRAPVRPRSSALHQRASVNPGSSGGGMATQVGLSNRDSDETEVAGNWLGGRHTLRLDYDTVRPLEGDSHVPTKMLLNIEVEGEAGEDPELMTEPEPPENPTISDQGG
ncbi:MAG: vWA domain-containing protein, partial [Galactobacter sp.]